MSVSGDAPTLTGWDPHRSPLHLRGAHVDHHLRGLSLGRLRGHRVLIGFIVGLTVLVGVGAGVVALVAPSSAPLCQPFTPCGPPVASHPLVSQTVWRSSQYGLSLEYPNDIFSPSSGGPAGLVLNFTGNDGSTGTVIVQSGPTSQAPPPQAITLSLSNLQGVSGLSPDSTPEDQLLGPGVGYHSGAGGVYSGFTNASQGVGQQQAIYAEAASNGRVTVTVTVITSGSSPDPKAQITRYADNLINSVRWR